MDPTDVVGESRSRHACSHKLPPCPDCSKACQSAIWESPCTRNVLVGATIVTSAGGVSKFDLSIAPSGRHTIMFYSKGLASWVSEIGALLVKPGSPRHLQIIQQPGPVQPKRALDVAPVVAIIDEAGNIVPSNARIRVSLMGNGSRAHDWIRGIDAVNTTAFGLGSVHRVLDGDLSTFHEGRSGTSLTFDLRHRYQINKVKIQCAMVPEDFNVSLDSTGASSPAQPRVVTVPASVPIDRFVFDALSRLCRSFYAAISLSNADDAKPDTALS